MRFPRMRRRPAAPGRPQGVRIVRPDGSTVPCRAARHGGVSADGITTWLVAPPEGAQADLAAGDRITSDVMPARSQLALFMIVLANPADEMRLTAALAPGTGASLLSGGSVMDECSACAMLVPVLAFPMHARWHRETDGGGAEPTGHRVTL